MRSIRIAQRRQALGLTQAQLAEELNLDRSALASYESGARQPGNERLIDMAIRCLELEKQIKEQDREFASDGNADEWLGDQIEPWDAAETADTWDTDVEHETSPQKARRGSYGRVRPF